MEFEMFGKKVDIDLNATLDLGEWFNRYEMLIETNDQIEITKAVYDDDAFTDQESVSKNPNLTSDQCAYLLKRLRNDDGHKLALITHPNFPLVLLRQLALEEKDDSILKAIANHSLADNETKTIAVLRIGSYPDYY